MERELNGVSFIDIILNHTANNSAWILEMNDSYYSPENTPHLRSAFVLDQAIQGFSTALIEKNYAHYPKGTKENSGLIFLSCDSASNKFIILLFPIQQ